MRALDHPLAAAQTADCDTPDQYSVKLHPDGGLSIVRLGRFASSSILTGRVVRRACVKGARDSVILAVILE